MDMAVSSIEKLFHHTNVHQGKILHFNPGDVIKGKVMKLFPNQTALVQFNGVPLVAQLQAPLTANTAYWFEVQTKLNGKLQLKVMTELQGIPERGEGMNSLLKALHVPSTKTNEQLLASLLKKDLPLPKHDLPSITNWLSSSTTADVDILTVEQMIKRNLPLTKETFLSVRSLYDGSSFIKQLQQILSVLDGDETTAPEKVQLKEMISRILFPMQLEKETTAVRELVQQWLTATSKEERYAAFSLLQKLSFLPPDVTEEQAVKKMGQQLQMQAMEGAMGKNTLSDSLDGNKIKKHDMSLSPRFPLENLFTSFLSKEEFKARLGMAGEQLLQLADLTKEEKAAIDGLNTFKGDSRLLSGTEGKELAKAFKLIFQSLGLEYERQLSQYVKNTANPLEKENFHTLKALLLQCQQHSTGEERDLTNQLIHKITGYQLSVREDGPVTSLYMQLPIVLGNTPHDVMIQWEGRQKQSGEIDPNYCHILFCLQLEHLNETLVNVSVQNRVINIGIINDHPQLSRLIKKMEPRLKENLAALNYHLSDVKVILPVNEQPLPFLKQTSVYQQNGPYAGVDIKI